MKITRDRSGRGAERLTIHLTPVMLERPMWRFTNEVWCVKRNREGSFENWYSKEAVSASHFFHFLICVQSYV